MRMAAGNMGYDEAVEKLRANPVQMYIDPQERRRIERRTGPLENMESGPGQVSLSDADSRELQQAGQGTAIPRHGRRLELGAVRPMTIPGCTSVRR